MNGKWAWISVLAVCAGIAGGALSMRQRKPAGIPRNTGAAVIASNDVALSGVIRPQHITAVTSTVAGNVEAFMANVGDEVYAGQVLARIGAAGLESEREAAAHAVEYAQEQVGKSDTLIASARLEASRAAADLQRAQMALDRAGKNYARQKTLHEAGATPRMVFEKAELEYESLQKEYDVMDKAAQAANDNVKNAQDQMAGAKKLLADKSQQLEEAQGAFETAEVRSPVDGLVVQRKAEVGKSVQESGGELFQIATDVFALEVPVEPQPAVLQRLRPGQPALVSVPDLQTGGIPGTVKELKDAQAIIEFSSTIPAIRPGMRADVRLKLE